jgi:hypothetical protein
MGDFLILWPNFVTIHKQYLYGFTIPKFVMMNSFINFNFFEHVINNSKLGFPNHFEDGMEIS